MAGPKKRLGKGSQRLKFKDVSPRAEAGDQELRPELEEVDLTPMAEAADQEHIGKKNYGGSIKPVAMKYGGRCKGMGKASRGGNFSRNG
jgi:hypothetical protein